MIHLVRRLYSGAAIVLNKAAEPLVKPLREISAMAFCVYGNGLDVEGAMFAQDRPRADC